MPPLTDANERIRAVNVTASEVGALLGEHPYTTPAAIYDRLCGARTGYSGPSESMAFGSAVEPILTRMAETALQATSLSPIRLRANGRTFMHRRVRLCATPDALVLGTNELVELKLSFSQNRWRDGLPKDIEWQARAQMACTGRSRVYVYVFSGIGKWYVVDRDYHGKEHRLTRAVERFWNEHVIPQIRPSEGQIISDIVYHREKK
jgi:predicted phage-related endonuclease